MIRSINDIEPVVAQKAITLIETLSENSIKAIIYCFELQFDCVLLDRPHIIKILLILYSVSPNQSILSWDFFLQRFSTLSIENQFKADILSDSSLGFSVITGAVLVFKNVICDCLVFLQPISST